MSDLESLQDQYDSGMYPRLSRVCCTPDLHLLRIGIVTDLYRILTKGCVQKCISGNEGYLKIGEGVCLDR